MTILDADGSGTELETIWERVAAIFDHQVTSDLAATNQSWLQNISNFWAAEFIINQKLKNECFGRNQKKSNFNNRKQFFQFATEAVQLSMRKNSRLEIFRQPLKMGA